MTTSPDSRRPDRTAAARGPGTRRVLARRGAGGYRQYRIPALARVGDTVLCAYDGRPDLDDLPAPIDLLVRRSTDSGHSWSPQQVVRTGTGFEGFGDPSLLADPATGAVLLFHAAGRQAGFFESGTGTDPGDPDVQQCDLSVSEDEGLTWRHRRLTEELRLTGNAHLDGERIAGMFASSGAGCALTVGPHTGRLVQPFVLRIGGRIDVACALSDDHGRSWHLARPLGAEANESAVCQLADGSVLLHSRGRPHRLAARSVDGGETFSPLAPVPDLADPSVNGSVIAAGGVLLASHCADPDLRRNATVSISEDDGASWRVLRTLEPGAAAYTQLAELPDGRIGMAYEADGYQEIRFEAFELAASPAGEATPSPVGVPDPSLAAPAPRPTAGWTRAQGPHGTVLDLLLDAVVARRPEVWQEAGPVHEIDLSRFADVDTTVFKEIGQDRDAEPAQVLRTRESLAANLGPVAPGIRAGDHLKAHARLRNEGEHPVRVDWDGETRTLAPGRSWVRRDLLHPVTDAEVDGARARLRTTAEVDGVPLSAGLPVATSPSGPVASASPTA